MENTKRTMHSKVLGENDMDTNHVVNLVEFLTGQRCLMIVTLAKDGQTHSYGDSDPKAVQLSLESMCSTATLELGAERALDIATGATVGRAPDAAV